MLIGIKVRLRPKRTEDAWQDYQWRRDPELAELDASFPVDETFEDYRHGYDWELQHPSRQRRRFAIETLSGKHIGNIAYFDINEKSGEAQLGIMVGDREYWGQGYGSEAVCLLLDHMFRDIGLKAVFLRTLDWNLRAQQSFKKNRFVVAGTLTEGKHNFVLMKLARAEWEEARQQGKQCVADGETPKVA